MTTTITPLLLALPLTLHFLLLTQALAAEAAGKQSDRPMSALRGELTRRDRSIRQAIERSHLRNERTQKFIKEMANNKKKGSTSYYSPSSAIDGAYVMKLGLGSPKARRLSLIIDTGSDLVWTQCQPCDGGCIPQNDALFDPRKSSSFVNMSCTDSLCLALSTGHSCDASSVCVYSYLYGDYSSTSGVLAYDTITLTDAATGRRAHRRHVAFGCGTSNSGNFGGADGIVGLGWTPLSLVSQLGESINYMFSYCLTDFAVQGPTSPLFLGSVAANVGKKAGETSLVKNHVAPYFYYLNLQGISVRGRRVRMPPGTFQLQADGTGGVIIDSGTTITYLEDPAYVPVLKAVKSSVSVKPSKNGNVGLDLCYDLRRNPARLPVITMHFDGGLKLVLPPENSFVDVQVSTNTTLTCLALSSAGPAGSMSIFGNIQQQNFHVFYDLTCKSIVFDKVKCSSM